MGKDIIDVSVAHEHPGQYRQLLVTEQGDNIEINDEAWYIE